ncbi:MAG: 4-hydroxy-tetrahydrodipicolinate reductase [Clostridia bacterium]|nr:4-hydroxy-tetrahydrodipicolinate reductase [Clostridia bacterium]
MKIILTGAAGRMGREMLAAVAATEGRITVSAAVDISGAEIPGIPSYTSLSDVREEADVLVDFSHHSATAGLLAFAAHRRLPLVIATTGQTEEERAAITAASADLPIFFSGNMSIGIALLISLARQAAAIFPEADVEIVEVHHNKKLDVPSGTALMLAEGVREVREGGDIVVGRHENGARGHGEIGVHSLRMGNIVGRHEVHINTGSQTLTLVHEAHSRALFAEGALRAAEYLIGRDAGIYSVRDLLGREGAE